MSKVRMRRRANGSPVQEPVAPTYEYFLRLLEHEPFMSVRKATVVHDARFVDDDGKDGIRWVLATEQPVMVYSGIEDHYIPEVLVISGVSVQPKIPLLDSHNNWYLEDVIGSVTTFATSSVGGYPSLEGTVSLSSRKRVREIKTDIEDGHVTDGSIGYVYSHKDTIILEDGDIVEYKGREYSGPMLLVLKWRLIEFSLTAIGADSFAKNME